MPHLKNKPEKPHPNRDVKLQDLLDLEKRLPSKKDLPDVSKIAGKQDIIDIVSKLASKSDWDILKAFLKELIELYGKQDATKKDLLATEKRLSKLITRPRFNWTIGLVQNKVQGKDKIMIIKITNEQKIPVTLNPKTDSGKPVKVENPEWSVVDGEATVEPSEDGLTAMLISGDNPGTTQVLVKADADLGEGVEEISEIIELQVAGATAKNLGLKVGEAVLKEEPAP